MRKKLLKITYNARIKLLKITCNTRKNKKQIDETMNKTHCVKSVCIRSYSGPYFPTFRLNTERYSESLRIKSKYDKMRTRITPNTDTFPQ